MKQISANDLANYLRLDYTEIVEIARSLGDSGRDYFWDGEELTISRDLTLSIVEIKQMGGVV